MIAGGNHAIAYATWQSPGTNYRFLPRLNRGNYLIYPIFTTFPKNVLGSGRLPRRVSGLLAMTEFWQVVALSKLTDKREFDVLDILSK